MTTAGHAGSASPSDLGALGVAARTRLGLVAALVVLAAGGWAWTAREMRGMDAGPWTSLGSVGWFLGTWVVMMAAMMLPSVAPTVALYTRLTKERTPLAPWLFTGGYLLTWAAAGLLAYAVGSLAGLWFGNALSWESAGRSIAGATLMVAGLYELTPLKNVCLARCRSPLGSFLGSWRGGRLGPMRMGVRNGAWCVGCCWALMAALFALGVMSVSWMALVAVIVAVEKVLPWRRTVTVGSAALLLALGLLVLLSPGIVPGLTIPSGQEMSMPVDKSH